ncbi:hypothetical protein H8B15_18215 [Hymenobacter sp. BT507]|uniref:GP-PDE domain-containing protein n=1 Tax=Hymenobacter citatus TaxID=2763506 RepID=A0ABR7MP66_9BACT|nr:glycerophosphodiester phosphodiesterase family protein [Hymenobacter citatus]MBC6612863.1 hypothetical protein [Hymenobacter citatus]
MKRSWSLGVLVVLSLVVAWRWLAVGEKVPPAQRQVLVIGHAGSGFFTPINPFNPLPPSSLRGIEHALDQGVDGVEIDVQLSQDSVPMLYHDPRFDTMTDGHGCVSEQPAAAITALHYRGGWPYDWFQQEQPATVETLLRQLQRRARRTGRYPVLHLDLHEYDACAPEGQQYRRSPVLARALGRVLRRYRVPPERLLLLTDHPQTLSLLRAAVPGAPLAVEIAKDDDFTAGLQAARQEQTQAVVLHKDVITPARSAEARAAGLEVVVFGGRSSASIRRILACHPDAMEVDNVPQLLTLLGR